MGETMRAVVQDRYGEPDDVLRLGEAPRPGGEGVKDDEALVRVAAAGVDRGVWHLVAGMPLVVRLGTGLRAPRRVVPGMDVAGVVEAVGQKVTTCRPGDAVYGTAVGSYAELARAKARKLAPLPAGLAPERAAAIPVSGLTALQAVRDRGKVAAGERVLVLGASGGVGSFAVQVAVADGAEVTGVCRGAKADFVRSLGAAHVVDHTTDDPTAGDPGYDVIIDIGGLTPLRRLRAALAERGRLVIVGGEGGGRRLGGVDRGVRAALLSPFVRQRLVMVVASEGREGLLALNELVEAGTVVPAVDDVLPLAEAGAALRRLTDGEVRGKLVLAV